MTHLGWAREAIAQTSSKKNSLERENHVANTTACQLNFKSTQGRGRWEEAAPGDDGKENYIEE